LKKLSAETKAIALSGFTPNYLLIPPFRNNNREAFAGLGLFFAQSAIACLNI
jgi:hypothetical protein